MNQPKFQTHQALLILGLQNEFVSPDGKFTVSTDNGFVERIKKIVPKFRELAGDVIWIRSEFKEKRIVNDGTEEGDVVMIDTDEQSNDITALPVPDRALEKSESAKSRRRSGRSKKKALKLLKKVSKKATTPQEGPEQALPDDGELFLSNPSNGPGCLPGSAGADFPDTIKPLIDRRQDIMIVKSHYSAFKETKLVTRLRVKLITELFICGCVTNLSVYATALDAARHGLAINLIDDCLGYRTRNRHDAAIKTMIEIMGVRTITSKAILDDLDAPPDEPSSQVAATGLEDKLGKMSIGEASRSKGGKSRQGDVDDIIESLASSSINDEQSKAMATLVDKEKSTPDTSPIERTQHVRRSIRTAASQPNMNKIDGKSKIRMRVTSDKGKSTEPPVEVEGKQGPSVVPPVPPLPNGHSKDAPPLNDNSETGKSNAAPPPITHSATKTVDPAREPNKINYESEENLVSSPNSKGRSSKSRLSSIKSSPSLRSTWPSGVVAALRRNSKIQPAEEIRETQEITPPPPASPLSSTKMSKKKIPNLSNLPTRGPGETIGEGDTYIKYSLLADSLRDSINDAIPLHSNIFYALYNEVRWQKMYHAGGEVPRLVAIQGTVDPKDSSKPIYRHPSDQSPPLLPWTHNVDVVRKEAERVVGHELNHCLIQLYRSGEDNISEHSDKTLDIVRGSSIVNVSFGAQRTMRLRTKKGYHPTVAAASKDAEDAKKDNENDKEVASRSTATNGDVQRITQRIPMPHNSIFVLGMNTNARWLHSIQPDKRAAVERSEAEKAYNGMRISLTFRHIGTFLSKDESEIWGQGAKSKSKELAGEVISGDKNEADKMIAAFGKENHNWELDWEGVYGEGFDVLHFTNS